MYDLAASLVPVNLTRLLCVLCVSQVLVTLSGHARKLCFPFCVVLTAWLAPTGKIAGQSLQSSLILVLRVLLTLLLKKKNYL